MIYTNGEYGRFIYAPPAHIAPGDHYAVVVHTADAHRLRAGAARAASEQNIRSALREGAGHIGAGALVQRQLDLARGFEHQICAILDRLGIGGCAPIPAASWQARRRELGSEFERERAQRALIAEAEAAGNAIHVWQSVKEWTVRFPDGREVRLPI